MSRWGRLECRLSYTLKKKKREKKVNFLGFWWFFKHSVYFFIYCYSSSHALISMTLIGFYIHAATSNIRDISFRTRYNKRHFSYISLTCFLPAETRTRSKVPLQCFESILCFWQRSWLCSGLTLKCSIIILSTVCNCVWNWMILNWNSGNGLFSWSNASLYEWRGCLLVIGRITERSCPCSNGRIISGKILCQEHLCSHC